MAYTSGGGALWRRLAAIAQSIIPSADDTYDLGSSSKKWAAIYGVLAVIATLTVTNLVVTSGQVFSINISDNLSSSVVFQENGSAYLSIVTSDGSEAVTIASNALEVPFNLVNGSMDIASGNLSVSGNVSATYFLGDVSQATGLTGSTDTVWAVDDEFLQNVSGTLTLNKTLLNDTVSLAETFSNPVAFSGLVTAANVNVTENITMSQVNISRNLTMLQEGHICLFENCSQYIMSNGTNVLIQVT